MDIEQLWSEYRTSLKAFLQARVSNPADVDDLLQDILIKAYKNLDSVNSKSSLKSWLFQIANHTVIDFYRKNRTFDTLNPDQLKHDDQAENIEQELSRCVEPFIKALPKQTCELLTAIDLNGVSQKDWAAKHGMSYSTLKSRVQKGRQQLRELFEDCCRFSLDQQGHVIDYESKIKNCKNC